MIFGDVLVGRFSGRSILSARLYFAVRRITGVGRHKLLIGWSSFNHPFTSITSSTITTTTSSSRSDFPYPHERLRPPVSRMAIQTVFLPLNTGVTRFGVLFIVYFLLIAYASATLITTFTNCLPELIQLSPKHLQFHPLAVDAIFDLSQFPYALNITVYGNVTGRSSADPEGTSDGETLKRWIPGLFIRGMSSQERETVSNQHAGLESRSLIGTSLE